MENMDGFLGEPVDIQAELNKAPDARIDNLPDATADTAADTAADTPADTAEVSRETPEDTPDTHKEKVVPIAALAEARKQAKEMRAKMEESERANAAAIAELSKKLEAAINPPPQEPSFDENPAENLRQRQDRLEREQKAWQEERERAAKENEAKTQQQQALSFVTAEMDKAETEFTAKTPDYQEAVKYLKAVSERNLKAMGVTDPTEIQRITFEQSLTMTANALRQGLNPAAVAYEFAKNYGYAHKVDATRQVKAMAEAQGRTQTLGNGKPETQLSISALAQMDDDELATALDTHWDKIKKMG